MRAARGSRSPTRRRRGRTRRRRRRWPGEVHGFRGEASATRFSRASGFRRARGGGGAGGRSSAQAVSGETALAAPSTAERHRGGCGGGRPCSEDARSRRLRRREAGGPEWAGAAAALSGRSGCSTARCRADRSSARRRRRARPASLRPGAAVAVTRRAIARARYAPPPGTPSDLRRRGAASRRCACTAPDHARRSDRPPHDVAGRGVCRAPRRGTLGVQRQLRRAHARLRR